MTIIWDSLALVVNTDTLPACTFLYFFVLSSLKCKIHSLNKRAFYFKKIVLIGILIILKLFFQSGHKPGENTYLI